MAEEKNKTEYYKIETRWGRGGESELVPSFATKFENGKLVDIVDLNTERAEKYMRVLECTREYADYPRLIGEKFGERYFASESDVFDYKKNSEVLVQKLKGKDLEYIKRAAPAIAFPPEGYKEEHRYRWSANAYVMPEEDFEKAAGKRGKVFASAVKLKGIKEKREERAEIRKTRDVLADKAQQLDMESEFAGFYETDPAKERAAKDKVRIEAYKDFKSIKR